MSRQFSVYLLPSDVQSLLRHLNSCLPLRILSEKSPTSELIELSTAVRESPVISSKATTSSVRCYLASADNARIETEFNAGPGSWVILPSSEAIQFSGCDFDGTTLFIGRLYFQTDVLAGGAIEPKREEFTKWADHVFRLAKKFLRRDVALGAYIGPDADAFRNRNGKLALGVKPSGEPIYVRMLKSGTP